MNGLRELPTINSLPVLAVDESRGRQQGVPSPSYTIQKGGISVNIIEAYKVHIEYTFNVFFKIVPRYAAITPWRKRSRRRQRELSFEYLTEEKYHPLSTKMIS